MIIFRAHARTYVVDVYVGWGKKFDMGFFWRENSWVGVVITTGDAENSRSRQKKLQLRVHCSSCLHQKASNKTIHTHISTTSKLYTKKAVNHCGCYMHLSIFKIWRNRTCLWHWAGTNMICIVSFLRSGKYTLFSGDIYHKMIFSFNYMNIRAIEHSF